MFIIFFAADHVLKELRSHQMVRVFATAIRDFSDRFFGADLLPLLTPKKRERIEKLVRAEDVIRALTGERLIRDIAGRELGIEAAAIQFDTNAYGKPFLVGHPGFHFNLSHSGRWVVCAVGANPVGIDVEQKGGADQETAAGLFSEEERQDLAAYSAADLRSHFYRLWTLKESFMKCIGKGFFADLGSFTIKIGDDGIFQKERSGAIDPRYTFRIFDLDRDYALAACSEGEAFVDDVTMV